MNIRNAAVLITGASRGLGRSLAQQLGALGARVALVARNRDALADVVRHIRAAGGEAYAIAADVGDKRAIHAIAGEAAALVGPIDILVNNASTLGPTPLRLLLDTECEDLEDVLAVNVIGPFRLTKLVAGSMVLRDHGIVINISSDAAVDAYPTWGAYGASKAALDHLTRIWAAELADTGVAFAAIDPGEMDTAMHTAAMPDADSTRLAHPDDVATRIVKAIASGNRQEVRYAASA